MIQRIFVKQKNVLLELCPISNYLTNAVSSLDSHPFKKLDQHGLQISINSDDPGIFGTDLLSEYKVLEQKHNYGLDDFKRINQMAYEHCFIPNKADFKDLFFY